MPDDANKQTCEGFRSQISELLTSGIDIENHPHVQACAICRELLQKIQTIAESARHFRFGTNDADTDDWSESM